MLRYLTTALVLTSALTLSASAQDSGKQDKNLDIRSSVGDLHIGGDADANKIGLPLYPGARIKVSDQSKNQANLSLLTDAFGFKLLVASYESDDDSAKIVDFYRDKLKRYGKVLECHSHKHGGNVDVDSDDKSPGDHKPLKCDENSGPVTELKVGTEDNQRIVAVEPHDSSKGSTFALVYVHARGKTGEI
jgi:hypothetical protein